MQSPCTAVHDSKTSGRHTQSALGLVMPCHGHKHGGMRIAIAEIALDTACVSRKSVDQHSTYMWSESGYAVRRHVIPMQAEWGSIKSACLLADVIFTLQAF